MKFVFIVTSIKMDIADSFEKRIKSRFSHRQIMFYEQSMESFNLAVKNIFNSHLLLSTGTARKAYKLLDGLYFGNEMND